MKTLINYLVPCLLASLIQIYSNAQNSWQWTITEGDEYNEYIMAIDYDDDGNIYACGSFQDTVDFFGEPLQTSGGYDAFIAAFDPDGNLLWVKQGGGEWDDGPRDLCVRDQFLYVTGGFVNQAVFESEVLVSDGARDMFLLKYDLTGNLIWATSDGSVTDDSGNSIAVDVNGSIYITGDINYTATFGLHTVTYYGFTDIFIAKYDEDGVCQWATSAGGPIYDYGSCIEVLDGNVIVSGSFNDEAVFGTTTINSVDFADIYIAQYLTDGSFVEVVSAGGTNNESIQCMAVDSDLNVYISGWYMLDITIGNNIMNSIGSYDIFLAKYVPGTGFAWSQSIGGFGLDEAYGLTCDLNNQLIITGTFEETISFATYTFTSEGYDDGFLGKFDSEGTFDWVFQAGGSGSIGARDCVSDENGNYYFAGDFVEELSIGGQTFNPGGGYDLFLSKLGEGTAVNEFSGGLQTKIDIFPNPCSGTVHLKYQIEDSRYPILELFTIEGRKIKDLVNKEMTVGFHEIKVDLSDLPAGIYYCVLRTSSGTTATKLIKL